MFINYYHALAKHDLVLAAKLKLKVYRPLVYGDGPSKFTYGEIVQTPWGAFSKQLVRIRRQ